MGAKVANFHHDVFVRMGWREGCEAIQDAYLEGQRDAAAAMVPTKMVEEIERDWRPTCLTTMILGGWPRENTRQRIIVAIRGRESRMDRRVTSLGSVRD
jgi:hypothetical protein